MMDTPSLLRELRPHPSNVTRPSVGRRRNGRLSSCEPCRKSKLSCNHETPCSRCLRRRMGDQCVYHPHPLEQNKSAPPDSGRLATPVSSTSDTPTSEHTRSIPVSEAISPSISDSDEQAIHNEHNPGYVGVTSYSTIFSDGFADLTVEPSNDHKCKIQESVTEKNMERSCEVLSFLQNRALVDDFADMFNQLEEDGGLLGRPILETWQKGMWETHGETLARQDRGEVRKLARLLWDNSHRLPPMSKDMSARQWAEGDTGMGLRWVTVGLIAAMVGLAAQQVLETHVLFRKHRVERKALLGQMGAVMSSCLDFYRQCDIIDLRLAWLVLAMSLMPSPNKGTFSYESYRESSELNDIIITMGLHQPPRTEVPLFHAELRKRTFLCAYAREIATATFLGRPPRLSHRYSTVEAPYDLSDDELFLDPPELAKVIANLDPMGFNREGKFRRSAYERGWISVTTTREDILDLALGKYTPEETIAAAARIQRTFRDTWATYPEYITRVCTEKLTMLRERQVAENLTPLQTLLQYSARHVRLSTELLLQLVLIRKVNSHSSKVNNSTATAASSQIPEIKPDTMIRIASDLLSGCLDLSQNNVLMYNFPQDISAFLGSQGMRAAAIVGVELLKQEQRLQRLQMQGLRLAEPPLLPRSRTIQDLAVFASRLEAVDPSDGMSAICTQGRKVIGRILDKLLTPEFSSAGVPVSLSNGGGGGGDRKPPSSAAAEPSNSQHQHQQQRGSLPSQTQASPQHQPSAAAQAYNHTDRQKQEQSSLPRSAASSIAAPSQSLHIHPSVLGINNSAAADHIHDPAPSPLATLANAAAVDASSCNLPPSVALDFSGPHPLSHPQLGTTDYYDTAMPDASSESAAARPQDTDLWNFVYGTTEAPFLGYDHDFMAWLENMDFDGVI
ncbi:uncharacterized protein B0I36DRAFT_335899 [Microdochium trichocladiopsis]|uniref:Zn(2)-C6 fungal-type domain-containing protein n=1 Tax=Microdochium trichocladiopsis TaxID=1682393 RepID=A0A9P8XV07_9PEZI|nr:uncharacterized protein B0I36DRAFT_335899 [Microdochium trichocladiopsis]KAH7018400.1 hypothetical protein B0I36DRAFT_335899 [Microdochium trichocladiopsis]